MADASGAAALFRVGLFQFAPVFGAVRDNLDALEETLARSERADLYVLPELFATGYQFISREEAMELAEPFPDGVTTKRLLRLAVERKTTFVAGLAERAGGVLYNSAVAVSPAGALAHYRKIHLFAEEKEWFSPGDLELSVFSAPAQESSAAARVGTMICFDWRFPEVARTLTLRGADLLAHPANLVHRHCPDAMMTRALENRVFAATANRAGSEARGGKSPLRFTGFSQVVSPAGERLLRMGESETGIRVVAIDLAAARDKRVTAWNDALGDRRPAFYEQ